jgi:hypothetical protein
MMSLIQKIQGWNVFFIYQISSTFTCHHLHPSKAMDEINDLHPKLVFFKTSILNVELWNLNTNVTNEKFSAQIQLFIPPCS